MLPALRGGAATRPANGHGAQREARRATVGGVEVLAVDVDSVAEPRDAAADHTLREVRERAARAVDHLETSRRPAARLEAWKLGVRVELLHLTVDVGVDPPEQLEGGFDALDEHRVERGERPEEMGAEASQDFRGRHFGRLAGARDQGEQLGLGVAPEGAVGHGPEPVGGAGQLALDEVDEVGEEDAFHPGRASVTDVRRHVNPYLPPRAFEDALDDHAEPFSPESASRTSALNTNSHCSASM